MVKENSMIDFTNCLLDLSSNYGGSDKKRGILYNGEKYMLKLSDKIPDEKKNSLNSSYTNSYLSEYICCHLIKMFGFDVQNTLLGTITLVSSKKEVKDYPVVACENFVPDGFSLVEFKFIENSLLTSKPPKIPKIEDIYEIMQTENAYFSKEFCEKALASYWDTFILDALLGNFDRHANNWGYLVNNTTNELILAPIYDCGSCLYPQLADDALESILASDDEMQMRIDKFPQAALTLENGEKASYKEYISSFVNQDCTDALLRVFPKINLDDIKIFINGMDCISDIRKEFYNTMLTKRYEQILEYPYLQLMEKENDNDFER